MEEIIKEGALRLLTTEASCDVILKCRECRLMAHKIILSIASPLLQDLLKHNRSVPAVIIVPDISSAVMTLILDYIYTGNVNVKEEVLTEFLDAADLLKIQIDDEFVKKFKYLNKYALDVEQKCSRMDEKVFVEDAEKKIKDQTNDVKKVKCQRKIPNLLPIFAVRNKKTYSHVIPSPWCPRVAPLMGDPRRDHPSITIPARQIKDPPLENDSNNNFQLNKFTKTHNQEISKILASPPEIQHRRTKFIHKKSILDYYRSTVSSHVDPQVLDREKGRTIEDKSTQNAMWSRPEIEDCQVEDLTQNKGASDLRIVNEEQKTLLNEVKTSSSSEENLSVENDVEHEKGDVKTFFTELSKPFKCDDCGKSFSQLRNYKYHRSIHEGTKEFSARCPECGKVFNDKGYLSSHLKIHRDRKEYGCPHCPKRFNQRVAYNMHLRIHTGVKPHECSTCGKTFSRKMLLKQHQRVHTGERPYSCPECGKSFADRSNMSLHARLHTGVKPYTCNLCSKSFTKKHHLKTHMNFHTGLKPYSCQKCGLSFSQSSNMRTHYKKCILKPSDSSEPENV